MTQKRKTGKVKTRKKYSFAQSIPLEDKRCIVPKESRQSPNTIQTVSRVERKLFFMGTNHPAIKRYYLATIIFFVSTNVPD